MSGHKFARGGSSKCARKYTNSRDWGRAGDTKRGHTDDDFMFMGMLHSEHNTRLAKKWFWCGTFPCKELIQTSGTQGKERRPVQRENIVFLESNNYFSIM